MHIMSYVELNYDFKNDVVQECPFICGNAIEINRGDFCLSQFQYFILVFISRLIFKCKYWNLEIGKLPVG